MVSSIVYRLSSSIYRLGFSTCSQKLVRHSTTPLANHSYYAHDQIALLKISFKIVRNRSHFLTGESAGVGDFDQLARFPRSAGEWTVIKLDSVRNQRLLNQLKLQYK